MAVGTLTVIRADGTLAVTDMLDHNRLQRLQVAVGGPIEVVPGWTSWEGQTCIVYCDEEGKLRGRALNETATRLWARALGCTRSSMPDHLVGDIAIVTGDEKFMEDM